MEKINMLTAFNPGRIVKDLASLNKIELFFLTVVLTVMVLISFSWESNFIGYVSSITGVVCVFLVNMRKLSNYFWGLINTVTYTYIAYTSNFYGEVLLFGLFYTPLQLLGAYMWAKRMDNVQEHVVARKITDLTTVVMLAATSLALVWLLSLVLSMLGGSLPLVDAATTVLSILASWFMVYGYREQWLVWITVNVLSIGMWAYRFAENGDNIAILAMWCVFLANSIYGAYTWFKASK